MSKQKSLSEKRANVQSVLRLGQGRVLAAHVRAVADLHGLTDRTVYRWLKSPSISGDAPTTQDDTEPKSSRFDVDLAMMTVVADEQCLRDAFAKLRAAGIVDVSYSTFCRAFDRGDPAVKHGALSGRKEMANNRIYLKKFSPHRCYAYHVDHTNADVLVLPTHRHTVPIRPHLTTITDAYSGLIWTFVWYRKPDSEHIAAALASVCLDHELEGFSVGGIPQQVVLDNAAEHFAEPLRTACTTMGVVLAPTSAYSSWQNGVAESAVRLVNGRVSKSAPGAIRVGADRSSTEFLASTRSKTKSENLWVASAFEAEVARVTHDLNTKVKRATRGGLTRLELFSQDPTDRLFLSPEAVRLACLPGDKKTYRSSKVGIQFRNRHYVCAELHPGREYRVRYLPGTTGFIEVFDLAENYVGRAHDQEVLSMSDRNRILASRARQERDVAAAREGVRQARVHRAALDNAGVDTQADDHDITEASVVDLYPARDPQVSQEPKREKLPRVPATKRAPSSHDAVSEEEEDMRRQHLYESPAGQEVVALIERLNAERAAAMATPSEEQNYDR